MWLRTWLGGRESQPVFAERVIIRDYGHFQCPSGISFNEPEVALFCLLSPAIRHASEASDVEWRPERA